MTNTMTKQIIILRGVPGAGKSTLAQQIIADACAKGEDAVAFSSDDYFTTPAGKYRFDSAQLPQAHTNCFRRFLEFLREGTGIAIVDNTNIRIFEMSPYILAGKAYEFEIKIIRLVCDPKIAAMRTFRGATSQMVQEMNDRMEAIPSFYPSEEVKMTE
ncbi:MAG: AAA family ATPase [Bacteroidota bacterium]